MNEKEMLCKIINETKARMQEMCLQHERKMTERDAEIARVKAETKELAKDCVCGIRRSGETAR